MKHFETPNGMIWSINGEPEMVGILPEMLSLNDPRSAQAQLHSGYAHGGGWRPFAGFTRSGALDDPESWTLTYPDDPPMRLIAFTVLRDEAIALFEGSWVAIVQLDGAVEIARMD
mgnify:CR=1 FL=1